MLRLPIDIIKEIPRFLPPRDIFPLTMVCNYVRMHVLDLGELEALGQLLNTLRAIIANSCPAYVPNSQFIIAGSFAAYYAIKQFGIHRDDLTLVYNDVDVYYRCPRSVVPDHDPSSDDPVAAYPRSTCETIDVLGRLYEINWIPVGNPSSQDIHIPLTAKKVIHTFDLNCVRVAYEVSNPGHTILKYVCPSFFEFLENHTIAIKYLIQKDYCIRSTAIRICYKSMLLSHHNNKQIPYNGEDLRGQLPSGRISSSSAKKIIELRRHKEHMPSWFMGLVMSKIPNRVNPHDWVFTLEAAVETGTTWKTAPRPTYWGEIIE